MTTTQQLSQPVTSLPLRQQQKPPNISLPTKETLYVFGVIAGTVCSAISQQVALTSIPLLGLLLMQRTNQQRLTLAQQQQHQQITTVVEQSLSSLSTQIQHLETQINETEPSPKNHLTKTHLTPIIAKLHQLQQENKVFKLKEIGDLTQQINTLQQDVDNLTHQTEKLQTSQQKIDQQFQQSSSPVQLSRQLKPTSNHPQKITELPSSLMALTSIIVPYNSGLNPLITQTF
jgi:predicted RNase H-like nuclease (RuvC/YqgF family)